jgi:DNA processing protein
MSTLPDFVTLSLLPLSWRRQIGEWLRAGRSPRSLIDDLVARDPGAPRSIATASNRTATVLGRATDLGIAAIAWDDPAYPLMLAAIPDPPPVLWVRGNPGVLARPAVAIVGSRAGSPYSLSVAERLAADLAGQGIVVVSGLARGVDSAAHRGAAGTGATVAVLGSGVDVVYPHEHASLAEQIAGKGAVVSELAPGTPPRKPFFPLRNRIISGLSRAVVIVEAGEKSGSLITARAALDQGRDVLAVPGNVLSGRNRGGHALLRDGARIVETAEDVLEELGGGWQGARDPGRPLTTSNSSGLTASAAPPDPVLDSLLPGEACDLDVIAVRTGLPVARILPRLLTLELEGRVVRAGGGRFVRFDRSC